MIDGDLRILVLRLRYDKGMSKRRIALALTISQKSVPRILIKNGTTKVPEEDEGEERRDD